MNIGNKLQVAKTIVTSKAGRTLLTTQKHSPVLLFGAGVIGVVATTVLASRATLRLEEVLNENDGKHETAKALLASGDERYTAKDYSKDAAKLKVQLVGNVARLYAPAIVVGTVSIFALTGSHVILSRRNASLMAAYATLDKGFTEYRERVGEFVGSDKEKELYHGSETQEITTTDEKGKTKTETVLKATGKSPYARLFSEQTTSEWSPTPEYNLVYLRTQQAFANDKLQAKGHVFLNEIYDALGLERSQAGQMVGWVKGYGDDFIDFGLFDNPDRFHDFMVGNEGAILLDFNVDGVVYDKIGRRT